MKKQLPKYFVIKRVKNNPLWIKYIEWLNKTYYQDWDGSYEAYYGYEGNMLYNGTNIFSNINMFKNNPTEITLEYWDKCVNGFQLPEKWCVKVGDPATKSVFDTKRLRWEFRP
jgi:hypothetical protein